MDGELSGIIFSLLVSDGLRAQRQPQIDLAILVFLHSFRRKHIGDHAMQSTKVFKRLKELAGLPDHLMVLEVLVNRM